MSLDLISAARPATALVLGSGLGGVVDSLGVETEVPFAEVPGLGASTVPGHAGRLVLCRLAGQAVLVAQGRRHLYEGLIAHEVAAGIRFMHSLGVRRVVLTNAAGAINAGFEVGGLMLITDHLNLQGTSPLLGGPHFHDMSEVYSKAWRARFQQAAAELGLRLHEGVYAALSGPQYETPAEIRMLRTLGAQAVGMSTVPETIVARHAGLQVLGLSMVTNMAAGMATQTLSHAQTLRQAQAASERACAALAAIIQALQ